MSDFIGGFWSWYVAGLTVISIAACLLLLWITAGKRVPGNADNTTGHVWDEDLRELNNPLPRWWMWLFVITIVFSAVYLALYPGLGTYKGIWNWSTNAEYSGERAQLQAATAPLFAEFSAKPVMALIREPRALAIGERLFMNNCAQCHGSDARGSKGFPNLTDADWLYGNAREIVAETITKGRAGLMPPLGAAVGNDAQIGDLAQYVLSLSGSPHDSIRAAAGKPKFAVCIACHGADGKGNQALGAPNLTDDIWLHGWGEAAIVAIIKNGKTNLMPAQEAKLSPEQIHVLVAYVLSLSSSPPVASAIAKP